MANKNVILPDYPSVACKKWLSVIDCEVYTGFSADYQRKLRTQGERDITMPYKRIGVTILYNRSEIDEFINCHAVQETA